LTGISLLAPLGDHRKTHIEPSKGRKRKRQSKDESTTSELPPPPTEIRRHILIGINATTRHLEALAARNAPATMLASADEDSTSDSELPRPISMVILTHPKPSLSPVHAHLPTLIHLSTIKTQIDTQPTRIVPLATSTEARLSSALHIPRIGALAILANAPGAKALENFVRENIDTTTCKWIDEAVGAEWRGVNVKGGVEVVVGRGKKSVEGA
jgi:ribonuclease P/MRP protein subunit POP3